MESAARATEPLACPVCAAGVAPAGQTECPNCRADLSPLARLAELKSRRRPSTSRPAASWTLPIVASLALGVVLGAVGRGSWPSRRPPPAPSPRTTPSPPKDPAVPGGEAAPRLTPGLGEVAGLLAGLDAVAVVETPQALELRLDAPLFARGSAVPSPAARGIAQRLAEALARSPLALRLRLEGITDPTPVRGSGPWRDNWDLGLARAHAFAAEMEAVWGEERVLRDLRLEISSAGASPRAQAVDAEDQRRTVLVTVTLPPEPVRRGRDPSR